MLKNFKGIKYPGRRHSAQREQELILKLQGGELDSFGHLYERFKKPIFKFILRQVRSRDVSEELTQDIFLKIYQYRNSYDPQYEVSTWIWTIARNTVYDYLRQSQPKTTEFQVVEHEVHAQTHQNEPHLIRTAETIIIEELERVKLMELMASLSSKQKQAIFLRLVQKFSYQEISKSMNLSLSAVKSLINRGKNTLIKLHGGIPEASISPGSAGVLAGADPSKSV